MNDLTPDSRRIYTSPLADPAGITELKETLGAGSATEIVDAFFQLVKEDIKNALISLETKDFDDFERHCHKIKSNVAYLGGKRLHEICIDVENFHVENDLKSIANVEETFKTCCAETLIALRKII